MSHTVPHHVESLHQIGKSSLSSLTLRYKSGALFSSKSDYKKPTDKSKEPIIPAPGLFRTLTFTTQDGDVTEQEKYPVLRDMPTVADCAVHLELLEVFFALRLRIINSEALDKTFGVKGRVKTVYRRVYNAKTYKNDVAKFKIKDTTWTLRRREKWVHYLHVAVGRFMTWARIADSAISTESEPRFSTTLAHLPPLDILMIWHAFLLNPGDYKKFCNKEKLESLYRVSFPWKRIHEAIDQRTLTYTLPSDSLTWTTTVGRMLPDLYEFLTSPHLPGSITNDLAKYGSITPTMLWRQRPQLRLGTGARRFDALKRGFVHAFQTATDDLARAEALVANVQRQASFVDKMHKHLWIRSPSVEGTIRRALERYVEFLQLFKLYPGTTLVPTLDIDLAWHTHQLSPLRYAAGCEAHVGRFIDHNDKIIPGQIDTGYDHTKALYQIHAGSAYAVCLCWDCQAIVSALETADEENDDLLNGVDVEALTERAKKEVEYHRIVEIARRKGEDELLPVKKSRKA